MARDLMAASDDEDAEEEISMVEQVARGDFADGDEMGSDGIVVHGGSPKTVTAGIAPKAQGGPVFVGSIIAEYDDYAEDNIYMDDETAALKRTPIHLSRSLSH